MRTPLTISVVVDNESWIVPYAYRLVEGWRQDGHRVRLCRRYEDVAKGDLAFFLGCVTKAPAHILQRNRHNLAVHESDLPRGRGFAPLAWQVLAGHNRIPIVLFEAVDDGDAGPIYLRDLITLRGHELSNELRALQGRKTVALCRRFVRRSPRVTATPQVGAPSYYSRRRPQDSRLDVDRTLREQFPLLRIVDNERYPAYFDLAGYRYFLRIEKAGPLRSRQRQPARPVREIS